MNIFYIRHFSHLFLVNIFLQPLHSLHLQSAISLLSSHSALTHPVFRFYFSVFISFLSFPVLFFVSSYIFSYFLLVPCCLSSTSLHHIHCFFPLCIYSFALLPFSRPTVHSFMLLLSLSFLIFPFHLSSNQILNIPLFSNFSSIFFLFFTFLHSITLLLFLSFQIFPFRPFPIKYLIVYLYFLTSLHFFPFFTPTVHSINAPPALAIRMIFRFHFFPIKYLLYLYFLTSPSFFLFFYRSFLYAPALSIRIIFRFHLFFQNHILSLP